MSRLRIRALSVVSLAAAFGWLSIVPAASAAQGAIAPRLAASRVNPARGLGGAAFQGLQRGVGKPAPPGAQGASTSGAGLPYGTVASARPGTVTNSTPGYAGYLAEPAAGSPVAVSFVVPALSCPSNSHLGVIPGVIAGGTSALGAGVELLCWPGQPKYQAVAFFNGPFTFLNVTIHAGDTVTVKVSDSPFASSSKATVADTTTGASGSASFPSFPMNSASIGDDYEYRAYTPLGMPPFGSIAFTGASVGGKSLGSLSPVGSNMSNGTTTLIQTSALNSAGTGFTTAVRRSLYPNTVQGRVIEGLAGQQTLAATPWPATFTTTEPLPSIFTATINWGDGTTTQVPSSAMQEVSADNCTYSPIASVGVCFAVPAQHKYIAGAASNYRVTVTVQGPGGAAFATGIAEIVNPTVFPPPPATNSVGVLTWNTGNTGNPVEMCTATALAGLDIVVTAKHCFQGDSHDSNFEFAPQHSGNCGSAPNGGKDTIVSISDCEAAGMGTDPFGYWTGTGAVYPSSDSNPADAGNQTDLVIMGDTSSTGYSLRGDIGGLPIHFDPPHGQLTFSAYGYPGRVGVWSVQSCPKLSDISNSADSVVGISPCGWGFGSSFDGHAEGVSGGPFVSSKFLPNAISAAMWKTCGPVCGLFPRATGWTAVGDPMSNNSMQVYLAATVGVPQP